MPLDTLFYLWFVLWWLVNSDYLYISSVFFVLKKKRKLCKKLNIFFYKNIWPVLAPKAGAVPLLSCHPTRTRLVDPEFSIDLKNDFLLSELDFLFSSIDLKEKFSRFEFCCCLKDEFLLVWPDFLETHCKIPQPCWDRFAPAKFSISVILFFPIYSKNFRYLACSCKVSFQSMLIAFQSVKYLHWICEEKVDTSAAQPAPVPFINATTLTYYEEQDATEGFVLFRHHAVISWVIFTSTIFKLIFCWKDPWGITFLLPWFHIQERIDF